MRMLHVHVHVHVLVAPLALLAFVRVTLRDRGAEHQWP